MARPVLPTWPMMSPRFDLRALLHRVVEQVPVARLQAETVVDDDEIAVAALIAGVRDGAGRRGVHRLAAFARDVEAGMEVVRRP